LQLVTGCREQDQREHIDDFGDRRLCLADADHLDQNSIETGYLA